VEEETLSEYPLMIQNSGVDFSAFMQQAEGEEEETDGEVNERQTVSALLSRISSRV
jgi:hypothetical protein